LLQRADTIEVRNRSLVDAAHILMGMDGTTIGGLHDERRAASSTGLCLSLHPCPGHATIA
jgi:hypothetical protein